MASTTNSRLLDYLEELPGTAFRRLYEQPATVLAIFRRMLTNLAKCFVTSILFLEDSITLSTLETWTKSSSKKERDIALSILSRLHILKFSTTDQPVNLTNPFGESLRLALTGGDHGDSFGVPCTTPDKNVVTTEYLDTFARSQWEGILHYVVGDSNIEPNEGVRRLLEHGRFVTRVSGSRRTTKEGFSFLLQEVNSQVWTLLVLYLHNSANLNMDHIDVLHFFFMLGSLELGQDYDASHLTPTQRHLMLDLYDFGIVYQRKAEDKRFYPTRLATTLTSDFNSSRAAGANFDTALQSSSAGQGFIIETNFRVYAYTSSPLQILVLNLFAKLNSRFPNMVSGKITRDSIRNAIAAGITSEQIIQYLSTHAHPQMRKNIPVLPPTVVDQIRLWQIEGERMKATDGFLFRDFANFAEYDALRLYAEELGVLVWKNDGKRMFFVNSMEKQVGGYLKIWKSQRDSQKEGGSTKTKDERG